MGKTIVITGAGAGLGRSLARRFVGEGETVILLGRTLSKVQAVADELGERAMAVECDVSSADSVRAAFASIAERHQKIDALINNAAVYEPFTVAEATDRQIDSILATNLSGPIYCCRAAIPMMDRGAQIINVSSESVVVPFAMLSLYQASKAGLERFTDALADELKPQGIRVTTVRAGPMYDEGKEQPRWDPDAAARFYKGSVERGTDLRARPISASDAVTGVFRSILDLAPDVELLHVSVGARHP